MALVDQEPVLFSCSVEENVAYGTSRSVGPEEIRKACIYVYVYVYVCITYICIYTHYNMCTCNYIGVHLVQRALLHLPVPRRVQDRGRGAGGAYIYTYIYIYL